jgi:hypothetical protein
MIIALDKTRSIIVQSGTPVGQAAWLSRGLVLCSTYREDAKQHGYFLMTLEELKKAVDASE